MFDLLYKLGIDPQRSDIDVQVSSDQLVAACRSRLQALGLRDSELFVKSEKYGFVKKHLVKDVAPTLDLWADEQSLINQRRVAVAVFPAEGPPRSVDRELSSHFHPSDWVIEIDLRPAEQ
jgi:hypothetical protein